MANPEELDLLGLPKPKAKKEREQREVVLVRTARDAQRLQLDRLMRNPEKEVHIPEPRQEGRTYKVPDFVRNVMGSSAGAGSGEFHVYRQLRKKEITRVKLMEEQAERERLDSEFSRRQAEKAKAAEEKAARKRAKRLKKKQRMRNNKSRAKKTKTEGGSNEESTSESDEDRNSGEDKAAETKSSERSDSGPESKCEHSRNQTKNAE